MKNPPNIFDSEIFRRVSYTRREINGELFNLSDYPYLDIVLTDRCNSRCKFCIGDLLHKKLDCDAEIFKSQTEYAVNELGVKETLILGGEPTISPVLFDMIDVCKNLPLNKICMTTNGKKLRDQNFTKRVMSSGITHLNVSFMSADVEMQNFVHGSRNNISLDELGKIYKIADENGVHLRINNNVYKGNNDCVESLLEFYNRVKGICHSVKFSPLLKTDAYSVIPEINDFNKNYMLCPEAYESLFNGVLETFEGEYPIVKNFAVFGFVEYRAALAEIPIIFNYNHRGRMMQNATEKRQINNIKLLPNGNLSRSWNREELQHVIRFAPEKGEFNK